MFLILNKGKLLDVNCNTATAVLLQGCETWSLTLRGKHRLREFENVDGERYLGLRGRV